MKPLNEWAIEDLMYVIYHGTDLHDTDRDRHEFVAELLRRERERCAGECDTVASELTLVPSDDRGHGASVAAERIRAMT